MTKNFGAASRKRVLGKLRGLVATQSAPNGTSGTTLLEILEAADQQQKQALDRGRAVSAQVRSATKQTLRDRRQSFALEHWCQHPELDRLGMAELIKRKTEDAAAISTIANDIKGLKFRARRKPARL
jgi:hypothetical protein